MKTLFALPDRVETLVWFAGAPESVPLSITIRPAATPNKITMISTCTTRGSDRTEAVLSEGALNLLSRLTCPEAGVASFLPNRPNLTATYLSIATGNAKMVYLLSPTEWVIGASRAGALIANFVLFECWRAAWLRSQIHRHQAAERQSQSPTTCPLRLPGREPSRRESRVVSFEERLDEHQGPVYE